MSNQTATMASLKVRKSPSKAKISRTVAASANLPADMDKGKFETWVNTLFAKRRVIEESIQRAALVAIRHFMGESGDNSYMTFLCGQFREGSSEHLHMVSYFLKYGGQRLHAGKLKKDKSDDANIVLAQLNQWVDCPIAKVVSDTFGNEKEGTKAKAPVLQTSINTLAKQVEISYKLGDTDKEKFLADVSKMLRDAIAELEGNEDAMEKVNKRVTDINSFREKKKAA